MTATAKRAGRAYRQNMPPQMDVTVSACRACGGEGVQAWAFGAPQESERCLGTAHVTVGQECVECGGGRE